MGFIQVEPNSEEWLAERRNGIGASDSATLWGVTSYKTPEDLFKDKKGWGQAVQPDFRMIYGHYAEPSICNFTSDMMLEMGLIKEPLASIKGIHFDDKNPFLRASLDRAGSNEGTPTHEDFDFVMDAKNSGWAGHSHYKKSPTPFTSHWIQMQKQMLVAGADKAYLSQCICNEKFVIWEIDPIEPFQGAIRSIETLFWGMVEKADEFEAEVLDVVRDLFKNDLEDMKESSCSILAKYGK